jgi:spore germination protein YaaH
MGQFPPREPPPKRPSRRELPRPERPFDRLLRRRPERDPAPIIIGGTIAFLAIVIILVFLLSSVLSGGDDGASGDTIDIAQGITGRLAPIPTLPPGLEAASEYIEFELEGDNLQATIGLPLNEPTADASNLGFYTFLSSRWQRLLGVELVNDGRVAQNDFEAVPNNLAVLRVVSQAYIAAGSIPSGSTLHADANVRIVNPRDFAPSDDGSITGNPTPLQLEEDVEIMPTIVNSGEEANDIAQTIIASEELQAQHIQEIVSLVGDEGYAGIDLEYAQLDSSLEEEFTAFVTGLAELLHAEEAKLSLTLPPPSNQSSAYDWQAIGEGADYIRILPIANPVTYWEEMPDALSRLTQDVEPSKVMLVINPFSVETLGQVVRPIGYLQAMVQASETAIREPSDPSDIQPSSTVRLVAPNLDQEEGATTIAWNDDAAALSYTIGGTDRRNVFIGNAFSIGFKLELIQAYGLAGAVVSDASAQSDVPDVWPTVNDLVEAASVTLARPNDGALLPVWEAEAGDLGAGAGTSAVWTAPGDPGSYKITFIVSDGVRRFGRETVIEVGEPEDDDGDGTPIVTLAPDASPTPTPTPVPGTPTPTATPTPQTLAVEVGLLADGDDADSDYTNDELTSTGSDITYLVTIDNDSAVPVTIESYSDNFYGAVECLDQSNDDVLGLTLEADDGDGQGSIDGGNDTVQCFYTETASSEAGVTVVNVITASVGAGGQTAADQDDATVTTQ